MSFCNIYVNTCVQCQNWRLFYNLYILRRVLLLIVVQEWIMHDQFNLIQVNHILRIRSISHCVEIIYVFLYLIFRHLDISMDVIKIVMLFITYTQVKCPGVSLVTLTLCKVSIFLCKRYFVIHLKRLE